MPTTEITPREQAAGIHKSYSGEPKIWHPQHLPQAYTVRFSDQTTQKFSITASIKSELYADADEPEKLILLLRSDGIIFSSDKLETEERHKKWYIKLRMGIGFEPIITPEEEDKLHIFKYSPETDLEKTNVTKGVEFNILGSINGKASATPEAGGHVDAGLKVTRQINFVQEDLGQVARAEGRKLSWEWYLGQTGGDERTKVGNTTDPGEIGYALMTNMYNVKELPNIAKDGSWSPEVLGLWRLDRKYWGEKKSISFKIKSTAWTAAIHGPDLISASSAITAGLIDGRTVRALMTSLEPKEFETDIIINIDGIVN